MRRLPDRREPPLDPLAPAAADDDMARPFSRRKTCIVHRGLDDVDAVGAAAGNLAPHFLERPGLKIEDRRFRDVEVSAGQHRDCDVEALRSVLARGSGGWNREEEATDEQHCHPPARFCRAAAAGRAARPRMT